MITTGNWSVLLCLLPNGLERREIVSIGSHVTIVVGEVTTHGDAALVAAAPDLLAACSAMLDQYQDSEGQDVCDCRPEPYNQPHTCPACMARHAIAKAKGEVYERT